MNKNEVKLELQDGISFVGNRFGYQGNTAGELVFQTGLTGYPESITDPSYAGQILVFTYPLIGNYGFPNEELCEWGLDKNTESDKIAIKAIVVSEYVDSYSHWNSRSSLGDWMEKNKIVGISGVDTRQLVKIIRESGSCNARIYGESSKNVEYQNIEYQNLDVVSHNSTSITQPPDFVDIDKIDLVKEVTCGAVNTYNSNGCGSVLFYDCGAKNSQIRGLLKRGFQVVRVPYDYIPEDYQQYDGIFISNGPGNPERCHKLIDFIRDLMTKEDHPPIFGICLGHQIIGLAAGFKIEKMKYGNRGHNIPVEYFAEDCNTCLITSQNHGYCLSYQEVPKEWEVLFQNVNDGSNEGIYHRNNKIYSVQFHPEARGGPNDANFLFDIFKETIIGYQHPVELINYYLKNRINLPNIEIRDKNREIIPSYPICRGKILILGSGGLSIGQAGEFDYSGSQAIKAYKESGLEVILINPNIATIQTSKGLADKIYYLPINCEFVTQVIEKERPDYISISFGGQTSLNCGLELHKKGILHRFGVYVLGTNLDAIKISEDRDLFKNEIAKLGIHVPPSDCALNLEESRSIAEKIGYPVLVRSGFCLGGQGSGFANNRDELDDLVEKALQISNNVIIDKSLKGWKELEYEIVRDQYDNCIAVCNMENLDPLGIHTGESIVVAPSQTLSDIEYQKLRSVCFQIVRRLRVVGECNVQFTVNPHTFQFFVIEMNARLSRSSALASKATGYPLAYIAAKLSIGYSLPSLNNKITQTTTACFEPSLDYLVVKIPRWDLSKFPRVSKAIGSHMKSVGEVMAIGRNFTEAIQKGLRMVGDFGIGFSPLPDVDHNDIDNAVNPHCRRLIYIFNALYNKSLNIDQVNEKTGIDKWFLYQINKLVDCQHLMEAHQNNHSRFYSSGLLQLVKSVGFSDKQIAFALKTTETVIRENRYRLNIIPVVKQIDTVAGEFPCMTNYLFLTYNGNQNDNEFDNPQQTIIVLGSGVYRIGSSVEFDWCAVSCIRELRSNGVNAIMINNNPETVSTDYDEADKLYFEELTVETVSDIYHLENPDGLILSMGGQSSNNIAMELHRMKLKIMGTPPEMIDMAENRYKFSRLLDKIGVDQPSWKELNTIEDAKAFCSQVEYPCLIRPSYVLSGAAMNVVYREQDLETFLTDAKTVSPDHPVVISKFITEAKEIEVDAVARNGNVVILAISEHIENAGIHSGDATLVLPAQDLNKQTIKDIKKIVHKIGSNLNVDGPFNLQLIAKDNKLKVIECNLRVSRSFPFASKTLDINMINIATRIILGKDIDVPEKLKFDRVGVKVPQFSFHRLENADVVLGVEMASTGEVASFGCNRNIAYMKALMATGFKIPNINNSKVLLSIGSYRHKEEFLDCIKFIKEMGWTIYGTFGTVDYYQEQGYQIESLDDEEIERKIKAKEFDIIINIPVPQKVYQQHNKITLGYRIRRMSLDFKIPLLIDIKCAKLLVQSIYYYYHKGQILDDYFDCQGDINLVDEKVAQRSKLQMLPVTMENSLDCVSILNETNTKLNRTKVLYTDRHLTNVSQLNRNFLSQLFLRTQEIMYHPEMVRNTLAGKVIGMMFYTPSTRTRCSFESAIKRMGGDCINISSFGSSCQKGESFSDFIRSMEAYCDSLIIRTPNDVNINSFIQLTETRVINAGDIEEHPTQALLDAFTIREERGTLTGMKISIVGDLLNGRTVHSLIKLLTNYNVHYYFVSPPDLGLPDEYIEYLKRASIENDQITWTITSNLEEVIPLVDVIYMTRLQKERFTSMNNTNNIDWSSYCINPHNISNAKDNVVIMHPLPRNEEIDTKLDNDPRSAYFRQMKYGMYVRMAILEMMFS